MCFCERANVSKNEVGKKKVLIGKLNVKNV